MKRNQAQGIKVSTHVRSGKKVKVDPGIPPSNQCWVDRNLASVACNTKGWPQTNETDRCFGNNNSVQLKECLARVNYGDWWKSFTSCQNDASGQSCYDNRLGGALYGKCKQEHAIRLADTANWTPQASLQELGNCLRTIPE